MRPRIDQNQRNALILERSRALFSKLGYPEVSLMLIAKRCGLSRTALYRYCKSKRDIFDKVVIDLAQQLGVEFKTFIATHPDLTASDKIRMVMHRVVEVMGENIGLLNAITEYLIDQQRRGESVTHRVRRHTVTLRYALIRLIREGVANGEFQEAPCKLVGDMLFAQLEAAALQIAVTETMNMETLKKSIDMFLICLKAK